VGKGRGEQISQSIISPIPNSFGNGRGQLVYCRRKFAAQRLGDLAQDIDPHAVFSGFDSGDIRLHHANGLGQLVLRHSPGLTGGNDLSADAQAVIAELLSGHN